MQDAAGRYRVGIVEDDLVTRMLTEQALAELDCELALFDCGEALLADGGPRPDVCLIDVGLPGLSGIDLCRALREGGNDHTHVIFVSGHDDTETRLAAYDAGGNDYVVKPCPAEEMLRKLTLAFELLGERRQLSQQLSAATNTAFSAMTTMGELGAVMACMRALFAADSAQDVANAVGAAFDSYGLSVLQSLTIADTVHCVGASGACSPLEQSLLEHAALNGRLLEFAGRLSIAYPHLTLLVTNFPRNDPERAGRLRDHLAFIAEAADMRLDVLGQQARARARAGALLESAASLSAVLERIRLRQQEQRNAALDIATDHEIALSRAFLGMGLSEAQEETLTSMAESTTRKLAELQSIDVQEEHRLEQVITRLREFSVSD